LSAQFGTIPAQNHLKPPTEVSNERKNACCRICLVRVDETLQSVVPQVFSDAEAEVGFAESGDVFEAARHKLATAIAKAKKGEKSQ